MGNDWTGIPDPLPECLDPEQGDANNETDADNDADDVDDADKV